MIEAAMFWNEPNNKSHWDPELDPDWSIFADTVTRAGRAVAAINPAVIGMGGRLVVAGYHQDGPRQVNMQDWNWKGIDVVNAHERDPAVHRQGLQEAVAAVAGGRAGGRIDLGRLLTHVYPLDRLGEAITATRDKPQGFVKALGAYG